MELDVGLDEGIEHGIDETECEARQREADLKLLDYNDEDDAVIELNEEDAFVRTVLKYQKLWAFLEDCCNRLEMIKENLLRASDEVQYRSRVRVVTISQGLSGEPSVDSESQAAAQPGKDREASIDQLGATTEDAKFRKWMECVTAAFYFQHWHTAYELLFEPLREAWDKFFWSIHSNFDRPAKYDGSIRQEIDAVKKAGRLEAERSKVNNSHGILVTVLGEFHSDLDSFLRSHRALRHQNSKKIEYAKAFRDEHEWNKLSSEERTGLMHRLAASVFESKRYMVPNYSSRESDALVWEAVMLGGTQLKLQEMFRKVKKLRQNARNELDRLSPTKREGIEKVGGDGKKPDLVDDTLNSVTQLVDGLCLPMGTHSTRTDGVSGGEDDDDDAAADTERMAEDESVAEGESMVE